MLKNLDRNRNAGNLNMWMDQWFRMLFRESASRVSEKTISRIQLWRGVRQDSKWEFIVHNMEGSPLFGEVVPFDSHVSPRLKPPPGIVLHIHVIWPCNKHGMQLTFITHHSRCVSVHFPLETCEHLSSRVPLASFYHRTLDAYHENKSLCTQHPACSIGRIEKEREDAVCGLGPCLFCWQQNHAVGTFAAVQDWIAMFESFGTNESLFGTNNFMSISWKLLQTVWCLPHSEVLTSC